MSVSRRSAMATAGAALAMTQIAQVASAAEKSRGLAAAELYAISGEANAALMRGDIAQYTALVSLSEDFTLMSPFGGQPTRGSDYTPERMQAMGRFFRNGTFKQELVHSYASDDMVVLALIEQTNVEVGGLPAQDWSLRVTLVYRREGADWQLVHRHADPLAPGISLEMAAALARGDADSGPV
jgi:ketosteroid isomerase-like protein